MEFCQQLSAYYGDTSYGGDRLYGDLIEQAKLSDRMGYAAVGLTDLERRQPWTDTQLAAYGFSLQGRGAEQRPLRVQRHYGDRQTLSVKTRPQIRRGIARTHFAVIGLPFGKEPVCKLCDKIFPICKQRDLDIGAR